MISVEVLGAGREVGRSCLIVQLGSDDGAARVMLDCGVHLGQKEATLRYPDFRKWLGLPLTSTNTEVGEALNQRIDAVLITHIHLDHIGALPYLTQKLKYNGPVYSSAPTKSLGALLLADFLRPSEPDLRYPEGFINDEEHSFTCLPSDAFAALSQLHTINPGQVVSLRPRRRCKDQTLNPEQLKLLEIKTHLAGHVLGALMFEVSYGGLSALYTGDYNTNTDRLLDRARFPTLLRPDLLISEATYAIHVKDNRHNVQRDMCRTILHTLKAGGKVLVPCFAVGKAQEIASCLIEFLRENHESFPLLIGGVMTERVNSQYCQFSQYSRANATRRNDIADYKDPEAWDIEEDFLWAEGSVLPLYRLASELKHISFEDNFLGNNKPGVLFAAPAMVSGGLSLQALTVWAGNPKNLIVMTGSCVPGTIGNKLVTGSKSIQVNAKTSLTVACKVRYFPFANHAGYFGIRRAIEEVDPMSLMFVHGDAEGVYTLGHEIAEQMGIPVYCPANYDVVKIDVAAVRKLKHPSFAVTTDEQQTMSVQDPSNLGAEEGVCLVGQLTADMQFQQLVSKAFYQHYLSPPISCHHLLTEPPIWTGVNEWISTLSSPEALPQASEEEEGEMLEEEGCLPDDAETATAAVPLQGQSGLAEKVNFGDSSHALIFRTVYDDSIVPVLPKPTLDEPTIIERRLSLLQIARPITRFSGWVRLNAFRDLIAEMETMNGHAGNFAYLEKDGFGVAVFHAIGLSAVVALNETSRQTLVTEHDANVEGKRIPKLGKAAAGTDALFVTPMLLQIGQREKTYLENAYKPTGVPLRVSFFFQLKRLYRKPEELAAQHRQETAKPTILPSPGTASWEPAWQQPPQPQPQPAWEGWQQWKQPAWNNGEKEKPWEWQPPAQTWAPRPQTRPQDLPPTSTEPFVPPPRPEVFVPDTFQARPDRPDAFPPPQRPENYPPPQRPEAYAAPQRPEGYPPAQRPETFAAPHRPEGYPPPQRPETYAAPQRPESYPPPQRPETYAVPQRPEGYPPPQRSETYAAPQRPEGYPPPQRPDTYAVPQRPETYPPRAEAFPHRPEAFPHRPEAFPHRPEAFPHRPEAFPHRPVETFARPVESFPRPTSGPPRGPPRTESYGPYHPPGPYIHREQFIPTPRGDQEAPFVQSSPQPFIATPPQFASSRVELMSRPEPFHPRADPQFTRAADPPPYMAAPPPRIDCRPPTREPPFNAYPPRSEMYQEGYYGRPEGFGAMRPPPEAPRQEYRSEPYHPPEFAFRPPTLPEQYLGESFGGPPPWQGGSKTPPPWTLN